MVAHKLETTYHSGYKILLPVVCQWMWDRHIHGNYCKLSSIFLLDVIISHKCFWNDWPVVCSFETCTILWKNTVWLNYIWSEWLFESIPLFTVIFGPGYLVESICTYSYIGAPNRIVLQHIYFTDIVSWVAKSAEQIMNLYKCGINLLTNMLLFS